MSTFIILWYNDLFLSMNEKTYNIFFFFNIEEEHMEILELEM